MAFIPCINPSRCKGCKLCLAFCQMEVFTIDSQPNAAGYYPAVASNGQNCKGCLDCTMICPDLAITIERG